MKKNWRNFEQKIWLWFFSSFAIVGRLKYRACRTDHLDTIFLKLNRCISRTSSILVSGLLGQSGIVIVELINKETNDSNVYEKQKDWVTAIQAIRTKATLTSLSTNGGCINLPDHGFVVEPRTRWKERQLSHGTQVNGEELVSYSIHSRMSQRIMKLILNNRSKS